MKKLLDISALVSYNKVAKTAYLRRIIYTDVVMLPLGADSERSAGSSPVTRTILRGSSELLFFFLLKKYCNPIYIVV